MLVCLLDSTLATLLVFVLTLVFGREYWKEKTHSWPHEDRTMGILVGYQASLRPASQNGHEVFHATRSVNSTFEAIITKINFLFKHFFRLFPTEML